MPAWTRPLILDRGTFMGSALQILHNNGVYEFWKLVFAVKSPSPYLAMCRLHPLPMPSMHDLTAPPPALVYMFEFTINYADCVSAAEVEVVATDQLSIIFQLQHLGGIRMVSDMPAVSMEYLASGTADIGSVEDAGEQVAKDKVADPEFDQLLLAMPWLQHFGVDARF